MKKVALVGIGGFSKYHYDRIKELEQKGVVRVCAVMIRAASMARYAEMIQVLENEDVRIYDSYEAMLEGEKGLADIVVLPTGISDHCEMSIAALEAGYHTLCEKPVAGTLEECRLMEEAQHRTGRQLAICFQNIYSPLIQRMKEIALSGELGALQSAKTMVLWPRATAYYDNPWRGTLEFDGKTINDCPAMNATAHYLNNMLYVAGDTHDEAARIASVYGENYRVKKINSCDTQFLRVTTEAGVELNFMATHASDERVNPVAEYLFEYGKVEWDFSGTAVVYQKTVDGYEETERLVEKEGHHAFFRMIYQSMARAIDGGASPEATIRNSWQQILCVEKSLESGAIIDVPEEYIDSILVEEDDGTLNLKAGDENRFIRGIKPLMQRMYDEGIGFSEAGCSWAVESVNIETGLAVEGECV